MDAAAIIIASVVLGWTLCGALAPALPGLERLGLSFGLGAGAFTLAVFLAMLAGVPFTALAAAAIWAVLLAAGLWAVHRRGETIVPRPRFTRLGPVEFGLVGLIVIALAIPFAVAAYWPPYAWDSIAVWALKGKLIAATGSLADLTKSGWPFYPLNVSLQIGALYLLGGDFLQAIFPMYLLSLVALTVANLRQHAGTMVALACGLFLAATPLVQAQASIAYADLPFAFYYVASAVYLWRFLRERDTSQLVISSCLLGLAGWTRTEAPMYLAINVVLLLLFTRPLRQAIRAALLLAGIFAALWLPWTVYARLANYGDYFGFAPIGLADLLTGRLDVTRLSAIVGYFGQRIVATQEWGLLWFAVPVAAILGLRRWREAAPLAALVGLNALAVIYTYYVATAQTYFTVDWWLATGFDRMTLHWIPIVPFYLGMAIGRGSDALPPVGPGDRTPRFIRGSSKPA